jgi:hypothetical protein
MILLAMLDSARMAGMLEYFLTVWLSANAYNLNIALGGFCAGWAEEFVREQHLGQCFVYLLTSTAFPCGYASTRVEGYKPLAPIPSTAPADGNWQYPTHPTPGPLRAVGDVCAPLTSNYLGYAPVAVPSQPAHQYILRRDGTGLATPPMTTGCPTTPPPSKMLQPRQVSAICSSCPLSCLIWGVIV